MLYVVTKPVVDSEVELYCRKEAMEPAHSMPKRATLGGNGQQAAFRNLDRASQVDRSWFVGLPGSKPDIHFEVPVWHLKTYTGASSVVGTTIFGWTPPGMIVLLSL